MKQYNIVLIISFIIIIFGLINAQLSDDDWNDYYDSLNSYVDCRDRCRTNHDSGTIMDIGYCFQRCTYFWQ